MAEISTQKQSFIDLVNSMIAIREKGQTAIVKRENFLEFPDINENIEFNKGGVFAFASFGYMERLFRKLAASFGDKKYTNVKIESYREACGFFTGSLQVDFEKSDENQSEVIEFSWAGKGEIENTWDSFTTWKTSQL